MGLLYLIYTNTYFVLRKYYLYLRFLKEKITIEFKYEI